jgi:hypothetical protein
MKLAVLLSLILGIIGGVTEFSRRLESSTWLTKLRNAAIDSKLPALLAEHDPADQRVRPGLESMFEESRGNPKLVAAILLSSLRPDAADFAYRQLLDAKPEQLAPIASSLGHRMSQLQSWLKAEIDRPPEESGLTEQAPQRRANAAAILMLLDRPEATLELMRFDRYSTAPSNNPETRSTLIHTLGPAGVSPDLLVNRLDDRSVDVSVRRALIQSLGECFAPEAAVGPALVSTLCGIYRDDPDSGVHASAKWLLRHLGQAAKIAKLDSELIGRDRPGYQWRITRTGLTFVKIDDPKRRQSLEVSDTEIPRDLFFKFRPELRTADVLKYSPDPDGPIIKVNYVIGAEFCNWLTEQEGLPKDQTAYRNKTPGIKLEPVIITKPPEGFRLLTEQEFEYVCRGGATTSRFYGDSELLFNHYAWHLASQRLRVFPAGLLKPNDLGLFDILGNAAEVCQFTGKVDPQNQSVVCGGSVVDPVSSIHSGSKTGTLSVRDYGPVFLKVGLRVARSIQLDK